MKLKNIKALALAAVMLFALVLTACGSSEVAYKVSITDAAGTPYTQAVVKFMQNGQQVAMQIADDNGVAEKVLAKGDYTVELQFTDAKANFVYDQSNMTLSADKTELNIVLSMALGEEFYELSEGKAYYISEGSTNITLNPEGRSYFIFTPKQAGKYEFSLSGSDAAIGHFGGSVHYVWAESAEEVVDNKFTSDVKQDQLGGAIVIVGVDAGEGDAILNVVRIGDPTWTIEDEPWTIYQPKAEMTAFTLPANAKLVDFDLTAATDACKLVLNEADGYYHLNSADGPLVLVRLGRGAQTKYIASLGKMIETSGVVKYFYDEAGNFLKKESYTECLKNYYCDGTDADGNGEVESYYYLDPATETYPLTEDLAYILQQRGEYAGWYDVSSDTYVFKDGNGMPILDINPDIAWLFMCCYIG